MGIRASRKGTISSDGTTLTFMWTVCLSFTLRRCHMVGVLERIWKGAVVV
jgi:hypothetical protein